jgi:hypothetical protein
LTATEVALVNSYRRLQCKIKGYCQLRLVDANALLSQIATTVFLLTDLQCHLPFIIGGGFSTDGVHSYALIAKFIEAINMQYGSNLKGVDIGNYRILFPKAL